MNDPRRQPSPPLPLHYWRESPVVRPQRIAHWKGVLVVVFILLTPALLLAMLLVAGVFR